MVLDTSVNWLWIIIAAIVGFVVGWLWWGPLFGKTWMRLSGVKMKKKPEGMGGKMLIAFIANVIMAWVLAVLIIITAIGSLGGALMLGFTLWLGLVATVMVGGVLWKNEPWGLFWLNSVGWLVTILFMAGVLSVWGY
jgi:hypothetical protein